MEGQIALWMWIAAAAFFLTGVLIGIAYGRSETTSSQRVHALEAQLRQQQQELEKYREQVARHFMQTADLLHTLTANYRAVYEHLADGAQTLCAGQVRSLTPAALRERLLSNHSQEHAAANSHPAAHQAPDATSSPEQGPLQTDSAPPREDK
ncbi:MAG: DUF1043 family protein [Candidatus Binatia bacterium]|nr:DUF1043 family protein [Candidatus Binatia bacterium]